MGQSISLDDPKIQNGVHADLNILETYKLGTALLSDALVTSEASIDPEDASLTSSAGTEAGRLYGEMFKDDAKYAHTLNRLAEILTDRQTASDKGEGLDPQQSTTAEASVDANKAILSESSSPTSKETIRMLRKRFAILKVSSLGLSLVLSYISPRLSPPLPTPLSSPHPTPTRRSFTPISNSRAHPQLLLLPPLPHPSSLLPISSLHPPHPPPPQFSKQPRFAFPS